MRGFNSKLEKYDITIKRLFDAILNLNHEQQTKVMICVEEKIASFQTTSQISVEAVYSSKQEGP